MTVRSWKDFVIIIEFYTPYNIIPRCYGHVLASIVWSLLPYYSWSTYFFKSVIVLVYLWLIAYLVGLFLGLHWVLVSNRIKNFVMWLMVPLERIGLSSAVGDATFSDQNPQAAVQFLPVLLKTVYCSFQTLFLSIFILVFNGIVLFDIKGSR